VPLFMDIHEMDGVVNIDDVAKAHLADLQTQDAHDVRYLRYWVDESAGRIFCWSRRQTRTPPRTCTAKLMAWSPTASTESRKGRSGHASGEQPRRRFSRWKPLAGAGSAAAGLAAASNGLLPGTAAVTHAAVGTRRLGRRVA